MHGPLIALNVAKNILNQRPKESYSKAKGQHYFAYCAKYYLEYKDFKIHMNYLFLEKCPMGVIVVAIQHSKESHFNSYCKKDIDLKKI